MGKLWVSATYHYRSAGPLDVWGHRVDLGAEDRADERGNILIPGQLAEGEHSARVGRLVILDYQLERPTEHATGFVHFFSSELCALSLVATGFSNGSGDRRHHADFERLRAARETSEHGQ